MGHTHRHNSNTGRGRKRRKLQPFATVTPEGIAILAVLSPSALKIVLTILAHRTGRNRWVRLTHAAIARYTGFHVKSVTRSMRALYQQDWFETRVIRHNGNCRYDYRISLPEPKGRYAKVWRHEVRSPEFASMSRNATLVWLACKLHEDNKNRKKGFWPTQEVLGEFVGLTRRACNRAMLRLLKARVVVHIETQLDRFRVTWRWGPPTYRLSLLGVVA